MNKKFVRSIIMLCLASLTIGITYYRNKNTTKLFKQEQSIYFGIPAVVEFWLPSNTPQNTDDLFKKAWSEFDRLGAVFNAFSQKSEVGILNANTKKQKLKVSSDFAEILKESEFVYNIPKGAFDPTVFPLKMLWKTAEKTQKIPTPKQIQKTMWQLGFNKIDVKKLPEVNFLNSNIQFDFGGIAKGFAVDKVSKVLNQNDISEGLVQLGGEINAWSSNNSKKWTIGIQHPKNSNQIWGSITNTKTLRTSTSGNYRQPIVINGNSFYHVFDPRTGNPVNNKILSVTLVDLNNNVSNAVLDALTKSILVLGINEAIPTIVNLNIGALILIDHDNEVEEIVTKNLKSHYAIK
jgi:FAD:protein FMN transferase